MSIRHFHLSGVSLLIVAALVSGLHASVACAITPANRLASDQAQLDSALARLAASKARVQRVQRRSEDVGRRLDRLVARHEALQKQLSSRVGEMYRRGETPYVAVLMNASTYEDFVSSWALLGRVNRQDASLLRKLAESRRSTERAAGDLMRLQAQVAKDLDVQQREVARARVELASSRVALAVYQQRVHASTQQRPKPRSSGAERSSSRSDSSQDRTGSGAWKRAVASHYGRTFSGRGASGERIGPYSMIVAHKTLPFGTLVEFRYNGKRAVARVADRGPYGHGRTFDLGPGVIRVLGFSGVHSVQYRIIGR